MQSRHKYKDQRKGAKISPSENQIQIAAVQYCWAVHKVTAKHTPNELMRFLTDGQKIFMAKMGVRIGWPDLELFEKRGTYGALVIEIKIDPKAKISDEQKKWIEYLRERGYFAKVCVGLDDVLDTIDAYLKLKPHESLEHTNERIS